MEQGADAMDFDLNAGGELAAGPSKKGRRLELKHMREQFAPKLLDYTELKL
jgi:hypothetical protein